MTLINEAIYEYMVAEKIPPQGFLNIFLVEDGEFEDVFFNKYFTIEAVEILRTNKQ